MDRYPALMTSLTNAAEAPAERLLRIFENFEDAPEGGWSAAEQQELLQQLTLLAKLARTDAPDSLAQQLLCMMIEAKKRQLAVPDSQALHHARIAARALIAAQRKQHFSRNSHLYAMAASVFLFFGIGSMLLIDTPTTSSTTQLQTQASLQSEHPQLTAIPAPIGPVHNPQRLSDMIAKREKMRQGTCVFPEALMLAEADRSIYLKHVVKGDITSDYREQEIANRLMQNVRCDYTPMLMKNSIS